MGADTAVMRLLMGRVLHQGYQLFRSSVNFGVDRRHVELRLRGELRAGGLQATRAFLLRLGAAADEAAYQLLPRRRLQEHEQGVGHPGPDLPGALEVDL